MENFLNEYGVIALGTLLFIDELGVPLPMTTILFTTAIFIKAGSSNIPIESIYLIALFIPPISNTILFLAGKNGLRHWLKTHGHKVFLPNNRIQKAEKIFNKYGDKTVLLVAIIPGIRPVASVIAGSLNMKNSKFFFFHFLGLFLWANIVVGTGYFFGNDIINIVKTYKEVVIGVALIFIFISIYLSKNSKNY